MKNVIFLQNWTILTTTHESACRYFLPACQNANGFPIPTVNMLWLLTRGEHAWFLSVGTCLVRFCVCFSFCEVMFLNLKPFISLCWCLSCMWHLNWSHLTVKNKVLYVSEATDLWKHRIVSYYANSNHPRLQHFFFGRT
jgi:hypothetical protein